MFRLHDARISTLPNSEPPTSSSSEITFSAPIQIPPSLTMLLIDSELKTKWKIKRSSASKEEDEDDDDEGEE